MKYALLLVFFLSFTLLASAQGKPLTQPEYVKMLYGLQKAPSSKSDIVEALRKRGIDFALTDGLRGLTRSKSGNDEDLRRALEEAERRRENPEAAKMPSAKEAVEVLEMSRKNTLAALDEMPDFVVKQLIARSEAYAGTGNWRPLDNVIIAVSFSTEKGEQYRVLSVDGAPVNSGTGNNYSNLSGSTTGGEFVEDLSKLFKPESKTEFNILTTDVIRNHPTFVYDFEILLENNKNGGVGFKTSNGSGGYSFTSVPAGEKGRVWIDKKNGRVLRIQFKATGIPADFSVRAYESTIDYDWVEIAGEKHLLPIVADNKFTSSYGNKLFQDRNYIRFKNYQKYGTDVIILDDDKTPPPEEKPQP